MKSVRKILLVRSHINNTIYAFELPASFKFVCVMWKRATSL